YRLRVPVAALLRASTRRIAFHYEKFRLCRIFRRTVRELSRKRESVEHTFSQNGFPRRLCRLPRFCREKNMLDDTPRFAGPLLQKFTEPFVYHAFDGRFRFG